MNLFNISLKNVQNSISNYLMYFASIVFSVFIFFSFKSIQYNDSLAHISKSFKSGINAASIVIIVFAFMFIYYSNMFFVNRRKNEIGTYSLLGMRKGQIGKIFLYESFIIGIAAIILGILLGFIFAKLMAMILIKLMGSSLVVKMALSLNAIMQTIGVFAILFIIIGIKNNIMIRSTKLINFFKKEREVINTKKVSLIVKGILGIILIIISYVTASSNMFFDNLVMAPIVLIMIIPGTFLFFSSAISVMLNLIKKNKYFYYKGNNLIAVSELSYKISSNYKILSTVAILVATCVTALGFTVSLYYDINKNITDNYKFSYNINAQNQKVNHDINNILNENKNYNKVEFDKTIDLINSDVKYILTNKKNKKAEEHTIGIQIIKESDFQSIMKHQNRTYNNLKNKNDSYNFRDKGASLFYDSMINQRITLLNENINLTINKEYTDILLNSESSKDLIVVQDVVFNQIKSKQNIYKLRIIDIANERKAINMSIQIQNIVNKDIEFNHPYNFTSSITMHKELIEFYGLMLFIGIFLSIIFLLCTGSILLIKQLSSIYDDKDRYTMLKKLGAKDKNIKKILSKQLKVMFLLPLIVGTMHSLFAIAIVQKLIPRPIVVPVIITLGVYYLGYFVYYFITLKYAENMIIK
ncbi:FtsX-like permease family protein [Clostridium estertheticum]|uniref:ABC transporter permease n=1 Tax=Clostridium estertheticum TaxID=238834 RepID=UPI001C0AA629|nr:FtsX-like permease family protein [Clostridium estertheticum]MBU3201141.1 FtsX-like permease family protein [Clostridium estertheticum]WAG66554.1 FtsX-like permease family protein [Clostridium estertheticum]